MPTTTGLATSYIQFTRTSNATVTDSDGKIKWAGHNLLTNSESFDAAAYSKTNVTVTANNTVAPNGTTTADKVEVTATAATVMFQATSAVNGPCTFSIWVKKGNIANRMNVFLVRNSTTATNLLGITINYDTGAFVYDVGSSGALVENAGSGWWKITMTVTSGVNLSDTMLFYTGASGGSYTAGDHVFFWGAHVFRSDLGGMVLNPARGDAYYPTTPQNMIGWTEDFSNAAWSKSSTSVSTNLAIAPNGLQTADLLYPASTGTGRQAFQTAACVSGTRYMNSFYVKSAGFQWIALISPRGITYGVYFDIINGVKGTEAGGCTGTITPVGNGWFRCTVTDVMAATTAYTGFVFVDANGSTTATASGTSGAYFWGAQLSDSASLDTYSPVYGAAVTSAAYYAPRLDYSGSSLAALGLLVEEQRTNLLLQSNDLANASWTLANPGSRTASTDVAPDGTTSAATITDNISGNFTSVRQTLTVTNNSAAYAASVYIKKTTSASSYPGVSLALTGGTAKYASAALNTTTGVATARTGETPDFLVVRDAGSYWRLSFGITNNTTGNTSLQLDIYAAVNADASATWVAATTGSVVAWGAQLEAGSFATSYIPNGSAVAGATRTADIASVSTQAFPYSTTASTFVVNVSLLSVNTIGFKTFGTISDGTTTNRIAMYLQSGGNSALQLVVSGGSTQSIITTGVVSENTPFRMGTAVTTNDAVAYLNGTAGTPDTTVTMPAAATTMNIGGNMSGGEPINGWVRQITYIPRRISNAELQARTV